MRTLTDAEVRQAIIVELVKRLPSKLGRTGVMKLIYFLQALKDVRFGYSFRLYNYGPYDGQVLEDLRLAEANKAITATPFGWPGGSGYIISLGEQADAISKQYRSDVSKFDEALDWVAKEFGTRAASDLELASTIVFADKDTKAKGQTIDTDGLVKKVHEIKPHHDAKKIRAEIEELKGRKLLQ
jgi:uncharacterized protein